MNCNEFNEIIYEYIFKELDEKQCILVEKHMKQCELCEKEYLKLTNLLIYDVSILNEVEEVIKVPDKLLDNIKNKIIKKTKIQKRILFIGAIIMIFTLILPVYANYYYKIPIIKKYIDVNLLTLDEFQNGKGQLIKSKKSELNGVSFKVDAVVNKDNKFNIYFTTKLNEIDNRKNYAVSASDVFVEDQFGFQHRIREGASIVSNSYENGESLQMYIIDKPINLLTYKLKVYITAVEIGYLDIETKEEIKYKTVYGMWSNEFYLKRSLWDLGGGF